MTESNENPQNDPREAAADPPSEHETPGGNPVQDQSAPDPQPSTSVQTPDGTVVETKSDDGSD